MIDLPSAYLHAYMKDIVHMRLTSKLAEPMVATTHKIYRPFVTYGTGNVPVLYVKLKKALYRCLKSALLFYEKLRGDLEGIGFKINPYDPCDENAVVKGQQMTVC